MRELALPLVYFVFATSSHGAVSDASRRRNHAKTTYVDVAHDTGDVVMFTLLASPSTSARNGTVFAAGCASAPACILTKAAVGAGVDVRGEGDPEGRRKGRVC